jgi:ankyrin repeat protein
MPENKHGIDLDGWDLHRAVKENRADIVRALIARGDDVDEMDEDGFTPLFDAVGADSLELAELLIDKGGAEVNTTGRDPDSPFCAVKSIELAQLLIKHGAVVDAYDCKRPMIHAAETDSLELAELLIDKGAHLKFGYNDYFNPVFEIVDVHVDPSLFIDEAFYAHPLHIAVHNGSVMVTKLLLSHNAEVDSTTMLAYEAEIGGHGEITQYDFEHQTPLFYAVDLANEEGWQRIRIIELLIKHGADVNAIDFLGQTPLDIACHRNFWEAVRMLIQHGVDVNTPIYRIDPDSDEQLLVDSIHAEIERYDEISQMSDILDEGYIVTGAARARFVAEAIRNAGGSVEEGVNFYYGALPESTVLDYAIAHCKDTKDTASLHIGPLFEERIPLIQQLFKKGADVQLGQPLHYAIEVDSSELVAKLINEGLKVFRCHLRHVVASNATNVLRGLIDTDGDMDFSPALQQAGQENNHQHADILLHHGVGVNSKDVDGNTSLHYAAMKNSIKVARLLLRSDADYNVQNRAGKTPLFFAATRDSLDVANLLIEKGASLTHEDDDGNTALHFAANMGSVQVARLLIEKGMCINKTNDSNITPRQEAEWASIGNARVKSQWRKIWSTCKANHQSVAECTPHTESIELNQGVRGARPEQQEHYFCSGDDDVWVSYWGERVVEWDRGEPYL